MQLETLLQYVVISKNIKILSIIVQADSCNQGFYFAEVIGELKNIFWFYYSRKEFFFIRNMGFG